MMDWTTSKFIFSNPWDDYGEDDDNDASGEKLVVMMMMIAIRIMVMVEWVRELLMTFVAWLLIEN